MKIGVQFMGLDADQRETVELLVSRVVEGMAPPSLETLPRGASDVQVRNALARIPLAHRIGLAKRAHSRERQFLRMDADPQVLEALARNPNITMPEIIALARLQQLLPSTLEILAEDPRWKHSDEVTILLATHPRATFQTVDKLIAKCNDLLLQRIIHQPGLNPAVRENVMRRLVRTRRG